MNTTFQQSGISLALACAVLITAGNAVSIANSKPQGYEAFDLSKEYQPDFERPRKYSREEMEILAQKVLAKIGKRLGTPFDRKDPEHVRALAEFFALTPRADLDPYSTAMEDGDIFYFSALDTQQDKELYPQNAIDLVIRFYWEGLARAAAAHYKLEVVNDKRSPNPVKSRGKVSDVATTAMFDKRPGMSVREAMTQGREKYDFARLIKHLKLKGLSASTWE